MTDERPIRLVNRLVVLTTVFLCTAGASAATLMPAMLGGQVQQFAENGKINGCGVTLFGVEQNQSGRALVFNGSVVLFNSGAALVKGRVSEVDSKRLSSPTFGPTDLKTLLSKNFWMKAPLASATTPLGAGIQKSEDKGYVLYGASLDAAFPIVQAVLDGEKIQIGFLTAGNKSEQVMFGVVSISDDEKEQLTICLRELISSKRKNAE
jgi:hypothetical protein